MEFKNFSPQELMKDMQKRTMALEVKNMSNDKAAKILGMILIDLKDSDHEKIIAINKAIQVLKGHKQFIDKENK